MMKNVTKVALLASALGFVGALPAMADPFTVNEGVVPGASANVLTANSMVFGYNAAISQNATGGFVENGYLTKSSFNNGVGGSPVNSQLNSLAPTGYGLYGLFTITGQATGTTGTGVTATFNSISLTLFLDPDQNTSFGFNAANPVGVTTAGAGEDIAIANIGPLVSGQAHIFAPPNQANGDFDALANIALTAFGSTYFTGPSPFYAFEDLSGNVATIGSTPGAADGLPNGGAGAFVAYVTGGGLEIVSGTTQVPEPASLALLGAGLIGLGALRRRSAK